MATLLLHDIQDLAACEIVWAEKKSLSANTLP